MSTRTTKGLKEGQAGGMRFSCFLIRLFVDVSGKEIVICCINLFLFSLCLVFLSFSFPSPRGVWAVCKQTREGGEEKKAETTVRISFCACQDSDLEELFLQLLTLSISAVHLTPISYLSRLCCPVSSQCEPPLLSFFFPFFSAAVFTGARTGPKLLGAT